MDSIQRILEKTLKSTDSNLHDVKGVAFRGGDEELIFTPAGEDGNLGLDEIPIIHPDAPPFLIVHGEADRTVPINQSEFLDAALKKAGVAVTFVRVKRGGHGFRGDCEPGPQQIQQLVAEFFDKHLKPNE